MEKKRIVVGISGLKGSGKDTIASILAEKGFEKHQFAGALKEWVSSALEVPREVMEDADFKENKFVESACFLGKTVQVIVNHAVKEMQLSPEQLNAIYKNLNTMNFMSVREILQKVGTEVFRNNVSDSFWIDVLNNRIGQTDKNIVISDARFPNERADIKRWNGLSVLVKRNTESTEDQHASENSLGTDEEYDMVFENNGTIEELKQKVEEWLEKIQ